MQQMLAVFVVAVMLGLMLWLRPHGMARFRLRLPGRKAPRRLELLERLPLTPQHSLHVVRMDGDAMLIGVSPSGCSLLQSWKAPQPQAAQGESA
jgi:flagellar biogenesis protein FliO